MDLVAGPMQITAGNGRGLDQTHHAFIGGLPFGILSAVVPQLGGEPGDRSAATGDDHLVAFLHRLDMLGEVMVGLAQPNG